MNNFESRRLFLGGAGFLGLTLAGRIITDKLYIPDLNLEKIRLTKNVYPDQPLGLGFNTPFAVSMRSGEEDNINSQQRRQWLEIYQNTGARWNRFLVTDELEFKMGEFNQKYIDKLVDFVRFTEINGKGNISLYPQIIDGYKLGGSMEVNVNYLASGELSPYISENNEPIDKEQLKKAQYRLFTDERYIKSYLLRLHKVLGVIAPYKCVKGIGLGNELDFKNWPDDEIRPVLNDWMKLVCEQLSTWGYRGVVLAGTARSNIVDSEIMKRTGVKFVAEEHVYNDESRTRLKAGLDEGKNIFVGEMGFATSILKNIVPLGDEQRSAMIAQTFIENLEENKGGYLIKLPGMGIWKFDFYYDGYGVDHKTLGVLKNIAKLYALAGV